ncbi:MAG: chorismate synthase [Myxococcota bacterium]
MSEADIQPDLDRRRPGTGRLASARKEADTVRIKSGVFEGRTTGTPIALLFENVDAKSSAYNEMQDLPAVASRTLRTTRSTGIGRGRGGRASARRRWRAAAGAVARKLLREGLGVEIVAWVDRVQDIEAGWTLEKGPRGLRSRRVGRGAPAGPAAAMTALIESVRKDGDTVGGVIGCVVRGLPAGLGEPVFDKLDARLACAMIGLPAAKGFEIGSGFEGTRLRGTEHNDAFVPGEGGPQTATNRSGGVQGGISNGMPVTFRVAFKPVATHFHPQDTVNRAGEAVRFQARGRHDPCVLPRAVVIVEAMCALELCDAWLRQRAIVPGG